MPDEIGRRGLPHIDLSRRALLRGGALSVGGLAAAALIGCGSDDDDENEAAATAAQGAAQPDSGAGTAPAAIPRGALVEEAGLPFPYNFPEPETAPKRGGTMNMAVTWDVATLDVTKSAAGGTITIPNTVYNRLLGIVGGTDVDPFKVQIEPELAESWERSPDGMSYTFHITPGVKWQNIAPLNGRAFTAADAKFAYDRYATEGVHQSYWVNVDSVEAVDDLTLKVNMKRAVADFIAPLGGRHQTIYPHELVDDGSIEKKAIGTGPMILKEALQSERVSYVKNPDYWEREVLLDGLDAKIITDASARLAAFRAGQIDYGVTPSSLTEVKALQDSNAGIQVNMTDLGYGAYPFGMNLENPKFADERVRRAISLSMDRDLVIEILYEGLAFVLPAIPWAFLFDERPTVESGVMGNWVRYDPEEAKQLLQAAGAEDLSISAIYFPYSESVGRNSELFIDTFRQSGITLTATAVDYTQFNSQWIGGTFEEATTSGYPASGFDADNYFYNQIHSQSPGNRWNINDPQIDEWAIAQQTELDPDKRKEIFRKIWDRDLDQAYRPVNAANLGFEVYQPWLRGIRFGGSLYSNGSFYDVGDQIAEAWLDK